MLFGGCCLPCRSCPTDQPDVITEWDLSTTVDPGGLIILATPHPIKSIKTIWYTIEYEGPDRIFDHTVLPYFPWFQWKDAYAQIAPLRDAEYNDWSYFEPQRSFLNGPIIPPSLHHRPKAGVIRWFTLLSGPTDSVWYDTVSTNLPYWYRHECGFPAEPLYLYCQNAYTHTSVHFRWRTIPAPP